MKQNFQSVADVMQWKCCQRNVVYMLKQTLSYKSFKLLEGHEGHMGASLKHAQSDDVAFTSTISAQLSMGTERAAQG